VRKKFGTILTWIGLVAIFCYVFSFSHSPAPSRHEDFETFRQDVEQGRVAAVRVNSNQITVTPLHDSDEPYVTLGTINDELTKVLSEQGVVVSQGEESNLLGTVLLVGAVFLLVLWLIGRFLRRAGGGTEGFLSLRKSRAKLISESSKVTFADVGGCAEAKLLLGDVIEFLKSPGRWTDAGVRLPRGVLLEGPPGCGKTLLARAVAGETQARFFLVSASEFVEMFVGVGAARVRDMFETAAKQAPSVIFIDELDAVGRRRGSGIGAAHDEREQTLNQLLASLDGFEALDQVVVIAATNRPDILDPALLRPGRFDRHIKIAEPTRDERLEILRIHTGNKPLGRDVALEELADRTNGFTGADLESLANEATLLAVRRSHGGDGQPPETSREDYQLALKPSESRTRRFNKVDAVLIESTTQLSEPTGRAVVRITLPEETCVEGEVVWADASFVKIRRDDDSETIVPKARVLKIEAIEGTESAGLRDVLPDPWAGQQPGLA